MVLTSSLSSRRRVYSRALKTGKSLFPPFPAGGEAVITNNWCIMSLSFEFIVHKFSLVRTRFQNSVN